MYSLYRIYEDSLVHFILAVPIFAGAAEVCTWTKIGLRHTVQNGGGFFHGCRGNI